MTINNSMSDAILSQIKKAAYDQGFIDGAKYAIEYLNDLFDGIEETDIYADYFSNEEETN